MCKVKKIVLPWLLALVLLVMNCAPVMAASQKYYFDLDYMVELQNAWVDEKDYPSGWKESSFVGYCYYAYNDTTLYVYATSGDIRITTYNDSDYCIQKYSSGNIYNFTYDISSNTLTIVTGRCSYNFSKSYIDDDLLVTTVDLLDADGNVFFQPTLPRLYQIAAGITAEALLREILAMTPLLIPLLAGYLGLRKALREILRILKTA